MSNQVVSIFFARKALGLSHYGVLQAMVRRELESATHYWRGEARIGVTRASLEALLARTPNGKLPTEAP